jgi:hypothetical protein
LDYQHARALPPLQLPAGQATRAFVPQYPVPEVRPATATAPVLTNPKGNRFLMPAPQPLSADAVRANQQSLMAMVIRCCVLMATATEFGILSVKLWSLVASKSLIAI